MLRLLDHSRPPNAPMNGPPGKKAAVTKDGYCIEYRETLWQHFWRYGEIWQVKKPLGVFELGIDRGVYLAVLYWAGRNGSNITMEKPSVLNFPKRMFWNKRQELKDMPKKTAQKLLIIETDKELAEADMLHLLENPNRPGPGYYDDCKKFNWATAMLKSHTKYVTDKGGDYEYY